jgi:hypothetical protein
MAIFLQQGPVEAGDSIVLFQGNATRSLTISACGECHVEAITTGFDRPAE